MLEILTLSPILAGPLIVALLLASSSKRRRRRPPASNQAESFDGAIGDGWRR